MFIHTEADFFAVIFRVVSLELAPSTGFQRKISVAGMSKCSSKPPWNEKAVSSATVLSQVLPLYPMRGWEAATGRHAFSDMLWAKR